MIMGVDITRAFRRLHFLWKRPCFDRVEERSTRRSSSSQAVARQDIRPRDSPEIDGGPRSALRFRTACASESRFECESVPSKRSGEECSDVARCARCAI